MTKFFKTIPVAFLLFAYACNNHQSTEAEGATITDSNTVLGDNTSTVSVATSATNLYPWDTTMQLLPETMAEREQQIKAANFPALKKAKKRPNHYDAQRALLFLYGDTLTQLVLHHNVNIAIGDCYESKNEKYEDCVTCMVLAYNRKTNDVDLGDARLLIKPSYDFYMGAGYWQAKEPSRLIPYDYNLFKLDFKKITY